MEFTVREWMNDLVVFVDAEASVADALALMRRRYIHSLIVKKSEHNADYGILTSTDICDKIVAQVQDPTKVLVYEVMNSPLVTVKTHMTLQDCAALMKTHGIHHLPVSDDHGNIVGMISATDFLVAAEAMGRAPGERIV